jgi:large subunit ribosomal protein L10
MEKKQILEKAKIQKSLHSKMSTAKSIVFVDFRGVSVADDTKARKTFRDNQVDYSVIKNTLANRAVNELGWKGLDGMFHGPTAMAASLVDPVAAARVLLGFAREIPALKVKGGVLEGGEVLDAAAVTYLGTLPSKEELIARVAGAMNSPITSLVMVLNATLTGFARAVNALREKQEQAAD